MSAASVRACACVFQRLLLRTWTDHHRALDDLMGLLRVMMPPKFQLLALLAFAVAMFFLENQIQKLEESRGKLGEWKMLQLGGRLHTLHEVDDQNQSVLSLFFRGGVSKMAVFYSLKSFSLDLSGA